MGTPIPSSAGLTAGIMGDPAAAARSDHPGASNDPSESGGGLPGMLGRSRIGMIGQFDGPPVGGVGRRGRRGGLAGVLGRVSLEGDWGHCMRRWL